MDSIETPRLLMNRHYVDIDSWGREVGWEFEYRQIEPGAASASAFVVGTSRCIAARGEFSRSFHQAGKPPDGVLTFGLPDQGVPEFRWCGSDAAGGDMLNFCLDGGFDGTTPANFSGYTLSFSEELLGKALERLGLDVDLAGLTRRHAVWCGVGSTTELLRQSLACVMRDARFRHTKEAGDFFDHAAASLVLQAISGESIVRNSAGPTQRQRAVRTALEWIDSHNSAPVTVSELCRRIGVSTPTLYRGFEEEFVVGPKRYLHIRRLSAVRKELFSSDAGRHIADKTNRWGFWHMGQFAADYRRQFGELPSQTREGARANKR